MRKIYRLREWLTLDEAAGHLSVVLGESVSVADIYRLALDGHLTLSVNLVNHAEAQFGVVTPFKDAPIVELPLPTACGAPGDVSRMPMGMLIEDAEEITDETEFVCFSDKVEYIDGVWDLSMRGAERIDIEHAFQQLTGGPPVELINTDGTFLVEPGGKWVVLQERLPPREVKRPDGTTKKENGNHIPAGGLPADAPLVVRMSALAEFQARLSALDAPAVAGRPELSTRERDTLLKLLIGMAVEAYRHDPAAARSAAPSEIAGDLAKHGLAVTDDTVRKYLKEAAATVLPKRGGG
jgi:hypothetical protein